MTVLGEGEFSDSYFGISDDDSIATVSVGPGFARITGVAQGSTTVTFKTDIEGTHTAQVAVTVT